MMVTRPCVRGGETNGFTLIELVFALTILGVLLAGIIGLISAGLGRMAYAHRRDEATASLSQEVDRLASLPFSHTDMSLGTHQKVVNDGDSLSWVLTNNVPVTGARRLTVTVSWLNPRNQTERFSVATYRVDRP